MLQDVHFPNPPTSPETNPNFFLLASPYWN